MINFKIAPSILSADFANLGEDIEYVLASGVDIIHFDVMDNHYVPNLTIGPMVFKCIKNYGIIAPIDIHLMVEPVDNLIQSFSDLGATYITFHPETTKHLDRSLQLIKDSGSNAGLAINPSTHINNITYVLHKLDIILLMSVNPGFSNQSFILNTLSKLQKIRKLLNHKKLNCKLAVDGGIKTNNIAKIAKCGANIFIIGSAFFNTSNKSNYIDITNKIYHQLKIKNKTV